MRQTSLIANRAAENSGVKQTHYKKILEALSKHKRGTSYQISKWTSLEYHSVARRMSELERDLKVVDLGKVGFSPSGLPATVWEITQNLARNKKKKSDGRKSNTNTKNDGMGT